MFKKEIKKIVISIITISTILLVSAWVYATTTINPSVTQFDPNNSEIWKIIRWFFDEEWYIKPEFLKKFANISQNIVPKWSWSTLIDSSIYINGSWNVWIWNYNPTSELDVVWNIKSWSKSWGVALTINDWYGNANVTWNHENGIPEQDGNSARIKVNTDHTSNAYMDFQLKDNVMSWSAVTLTSIMKLQSNGYVWIWTIDPIHKLDVNWNIEIRWRTAFFWDTQTIYWNNWSAFFMDSNNSDYSQLVFRDKEDTIYWKIFWASDGANFGLLDWDGNRTYRATKDYRTYFYIDNDIKMYIDEDWGVHATSFIYTSDKRLKKDIHTLENNLEKINKLRWVHFKWKKDSKNEIWLIAQEVEEIYPDLVDTNEEDWMKSVKYGNIVAILIEWVKELYNKVVGNTEEIEKLKEENIELKEQLSSLGKRMKVLEEKNKAK